MVRESFDDNKVQMRIGRGVKNHQNAKEDQNLTVSRFLNLENDTYVDRRSSSAFSVALFDELLHETMI